MKVMTINELKQCDGWGKLNEKYKCLSLCEEYSWNFGCLRLMDGLTYNIGATCQFEIIS